MNSSTDKNDKSEKGDFELTNTEEAVHAVEAPLIPKHWRQVWTFCYNNSFFCVNSVTYLMIDITLPLNKVLNFQQSNLWL